MTLMRIAEGKPLDFVKECNYYEIKVKIDYLTIIKLNHFHLINRNHTEP